MTMPSGFREQKATQVAAKLLELGGGQMNLMKLVKLIYLADREALIRWGKPITRDSFCSLRHGPIVSNTLNLINEEPDPNDPRYWHRFISERRTDYSVSLKQSPGNDQLSPLEEQVVKEVFERFGERTQWELRDFTHTLPEWRDPGESMLPIHLRDILIPEGYKEDEIKAIEEELKYLAAVQEEMADCDGELVE